MGHVNIKYEIICHFKNRTGSSASPLHIKLLYSTHTDQKEILYIKNKEPGTVVHGCNPSTEKAGTGGLLQVQGQFGLHKILTQKEKEKEIEIRKNSKCKGKKNI